MFGQKMGVYTNVVNLLFYEIKCKLSNHQKSFGWQKVIQEVQFSRKQNIGRLFGWLLIERIEKVELFEILFPTKWEIVLTHPPPTKEELSIETFNFHCQLNNFD